MWLNATPVIISILIKFPIGEESKARSNKSPEKKKKKKKK